MTSRTTADVEIRPSDVDEMREHAMGLFEAHRQELEPAMPPLDPDWTGYYEMEERGALIVFGAWAWTPDKAMVGYAVAFLLPSSHYKGMLRCHHDLLYVHKGYRKGRLGLELVRQVERVAYELGAVDILLHAKPGTAFERLLPKRGYEIEETVFRKELSCPQQ